MQSFENLRRRFDEQAGREPFRGVPEITERGLILGSGTVLARMAGSPDGRGLAIDRDEERMLALLSAVYGRQVSPHVMHFVRRASEQWGRGDKVLAQIELAFARLPRLEGRDDAFRLHLAEDLLARGFTPRRLTRALGFDPHLLKYDPRQPRVPAGHGRASGEWGKGDGAAQVETRPAAQSAPPSAAPSVGATFVPGTLASGLFTAEEGRSFLAGLGVLAASPAVGAIGATAFLGAIFVPFNRDNTVEGTLPGDPDLHYTFHPHDQPIVEFWREGQAAKRDIAFTGRAVGDILYETETGVPIARIVGDRLVMDAESLASVPEYGRSQAATQSDATSAKEEPQLCPDPGPDTPHGASARSIQYQAYISFLNNPLRPLLPGMAVSLPDPAGGRRVFYDDCREADGVMIEAKGLGYAKLLRSNYLRTVIARRWERQGTRQVRAAGVRGNEWFFAEKEARDFAEKEVFAKKEALEKIHAVYEPWLPKKKSETSPSGESE